MARECNEDSGNVQVRKIYQFFLGFLMQCNLSAITSMLYTIAGHLNANVDLFLVNLKCGLLLFSGLL